MDDDEYDDVADVDDDFNQIDHSEGTRCSTSGDLQRIRWAGEGRKGCYDGDDDDGEDHEDDKNFQLIIMIITIMMKLKVPESAHMRIELNKIDSAGLDNAEALR